MSTAESNGCSPSARLGWKPVKITPHASATKAAGRSPSAQAWRPPRELRKPLNVTLRYRGGPEAWWQLEARGRVYRFPGHESLLDALLRVYGH